MYRLKIKNSIFTIPKENIRMLAITKALDLKDDIPILNDDIAIAYLASLGIEVNEEVKE